MLSAERDEYSTINFEETELRLGLPGGCGGGGFAAGGNEAEVSKSGGKRGFSETETAAVDLKLNLSSSVTAAAGPAKDGGGEKCDELKLKDKAVTEKTAADSGKPPAKAQVVGWPPVRSFRKNITSAQKSTTNEAAFVKVSMDGAPYLRKVDLKMYQSYQELSQALAKMFSSFTIGNCGSQGMKDFINESKLIDLLNGSDYVPTYEDKDGDWMLVGDVPWEMFVDSCKRLRIMKGSEAIGLAPRAVEKRKSRS